MPMAIPELQREYQREWIATRRSDWFASNGPCRRCWLYKDLEIHHLDPQEKESNSIWSWSQERQDRELEKCIVLCESCHQKVHSFWRKEEALITAPHGTEKRYSSIFNCRCALCTYAHMMHMRMYRMGQYESSEKIYCPESSEVAGRAGP